MVWGGDMVARGYCGKIQYSPNTQKSSNENEIILDPPVTVVDNEIATLTITRFFSYVSNEGTENEKWSFGFEMDVTNNMDEFALNVYENNISLSDQRVISFYYLNSKGYVRSGKTQHPYCYGPRL